MSSRLAKVMLAMSLLVAVTPALARAPTRGQIRRAVSSARHSPMLWATVNICDTRRHPHMIGIRGQLPALAFATRLSMRIRVEYWSRRHRRFLLDPDPEARRNVYLGRTAKGLHQGGATFTFQPPALLRGVVSFQWKLGRKVIGKVTRITRGGYKHVDFGDPAGYSRATCTMK